MLNPITPTSTQEAVRQANEEWRPFPRFPAYEVSSYGRVRRVDTGRLLKTRIFPNGYPYVDLSFPGGKKTIKVSRSLCEAFHGPPPTLEHQAAHCDGVRANNLASNLRWATRIENNLDKLIHGTQTYGADQPCSKLTEEKVLAIRADTRSQVAIAADYGVSQCRVSLIKSRKAWAHLPEADL